MGEPLSPPDGQTRELLVDDLLDVWLRERFTACYVTHNLEEAVRLGHKIVVLSRRPVRIREVVELDVPLEQRKGQSFDLTWFSIVRKIILPGAMPAILSGFRISTFVAIILLIAGAVAGSRLA